MMPNTFKRFLSLMMALMIVAALMPVGAISVKADDNTNTIVDAAVIFSDLHTSNDDYKQSELQGVLNAIKNAGLPVSSVTSAGDAFSVNEDDDEEHGPYTGLTSTLTGYIQSIFSVPVSYVWSDHDRYAVQEDDTTLLDKTSRLVYGAGADGVYGTDDDANYYVYSLSMGDLCSYDRYNAGFNTDSGNSRVDNGFTDSVEKAISFFQADTAKLKKNRPLLIASHQPLFDNRNDNAFAELWFDAINEVAKEMDVVFFHGHNHKYDAVATDYYYAKGSTMPVATLSGWDDYQTDDGWQYNNDLQSTSKVLNFTHLCAGYLSPSSTGSVNASTTRQGTAMAVTIYENTINFTTYSENGVYNSGIAPINVTIDRDHGHIHNYETETETVAPTCTSTGSVTKVCSCGESKVEIIPALGHKYESVVTDPSCTEGGFTTYTCKVCGDSEIKDPTDARGHNYTKKSNATCTEDGVMVYTCEACGDSYTGETVSALGHNYSSTVIDPTCTANGYTAHVCSNCGDSYNDNEVTALGHKYTSVVTAPTCTANGFTTYTCEICDHSYKADEVQATGHDYESVVTPPTTEAEGYTTHTCKVCGDVKVDSKVPPLSHEYESVTVEANCTEDGYVTHTCTICGYTYTETLYAPGHNFVTSTIEATCTEEGYTNYTCSVCGDFFTDEYVPATGHNLEIVTVDPTCTTVGHTTSTCTNCDYSETVIIPLAEHAYTVIRKLEPTCTTIGYTTYLCDTCGNRKNDDYFSALGHSYETEAVAPTCTEKGYTAYVCSTCGDSYKENYIDATGHTHNVTVTAPTCTESGYTTFTCTVCNEVTIGNYVKAAGHRYDCVKSGNQLIYTCKVCSHSYSVTTEPDYIYTKASRLDSGESYVITLYSNKTYYALSHENDRISAVPVEVANNRVISEVTEDLLWNHDNNKLSYESDGITYYLSASSTKLSISISQSSSVVYSGNKMRVGTNYMRYASNKITMNRSATTAYLFMQNDA